MMKINHPDQRMLTELRIRHRTRATGSRRGVLDMTWKSCLAALAVACPFSIGSAWGAPTTPDLTITKTHVGNFAAGGSGSYTITVRNSGSDATKGTTTVTDTLPPGLTP